MSEGWTPPPRISVPQWADDYRKLAKEAGSTSGNWETSTVEIARGPMLAATESGVHIITVMCCTQLMKTALLENLFGYFAHLDPCPILLLQPKEEAAEQFSKERISPLVRVTPVLRNIIGDSKQKSSKETILYKAFTGGFLALAGAGSQITLRAVRSVFCWQMRWINIRLPVRAIPSLWRKSEPPHLALTGCPCGLVRRRSKMKAGLLTVTKIQISGGPL